MFSFTDLEIVAVVDVQAIKDVILLRKLYRWVFVLWAKDCYV